MRRLLIAVLSVLAAATFAAGHSAAQGPGSAKATAKAPAKAPTVAEDIARWVVALHTDCSSSEMRTAPHARSCRPSVPTLILGSTLGPTGCTNGTTTALTPARPLLAIVPSPSPIAHASFILLLVLYST